MILLSVHLQFLLKVGLYWVEVYFIFTIFTGVETSSLAGRRAKFSFICVPVDQNHNVSVSHLDHKTEARDINSTEELSVLPPDIFNICDLLNVFVWLSCCDVVYMHFVLTLTRQPKFPFNLELKRTRVFPASIIEGFKSRILVFPWLISYQYLREWKLMKTDAG